MSRNSAYTLFELLAVIAILVIIVAVTQPVFARALQASKESGTKSNLHQHYVALEIYRADYESTSYGRASEMGYPLPEQIISSKLNLPKTVWESPCDPDAQQKTDDIGELGFSYMYLPSDSDEFLANTILKESRTFLLADLTCNPYPPTFGAFLKKKVIAIRMSGQVSTLNRFGNPVDFKWWASQE